MIETLLGLLVGWLLTRDRKGGPSPAPGPAPGPAYPPWAPSTPVNPGPYPGTPGGPSPTPVTPVTPWPTTPVLPGQMRVYTIAKDDLPYLVGKRLSGTVKDSTGRWQWKKLDRTADGQAINTDGENPHPWSAGLRLLVPPGFTSDLGRMPNANGDVSVINSGTPPAPIPPPQPPSIDPSKPPPNWPADKPWPGWYDPRNPPFAGTFDPSNPPQPWIFPHPFPNTPQPWHNWGKGGGSGNVSGEGDEELDEESVEPLNLGDDEDEETV